MKKTRNILLVFLLAVGVYFSFNVATADKVGGSASDPLVTKSYVDSKLEFIDELAEKIERKLDDLEDADYDRKDKRRNDEEDDRDDRDESKKSDDYKKLEEKLALLEKANAEQKEELEKKDAELKDNDADSSENKDVPEGFSHSDFFTVLEAKQGEKLLLGASAECVLRAGEGLVVMGEYGGLADLTDGKDLRGDDAVPAQHLLLSSRNDGRGIFITSETTSYILVKGDYKLQ